MGRRRLRADLPRGVGSSRFRAHTGGREPSPPLRHLEGVPHHGLRPALLLTLLLPACAVEDGGRAPGLDDGGSACSGGKCDHTEQHSACSGQAAANCTAEPCGYALEHPLFSVEWACDEGDVDILEQRVRSELGGAVFGYAWTVDLGLDLTLPDNAELQGNQCRLTKALLDCVMPNLGASQLCTLSDGNTGVEYPDTLPGYCLRIHNTTGAWAHGARRAVDFNVPTNSGNIVGCSSGKVLDPEASDYWEEYLCTNRSETARLDLPPRFVSLMEGCGFSWGGHWGDPAGDAEAEGRHLGCDPMHFELPE